MVDLDGKLLTSEKNVEKLAIEVFENRLRNRDMKPELSEMKEDKEYLCEMRLKIAEKNKTATLDIKGIRKSVKVSQK